MRINHNITALNNHRNMGMNDVKAGKSMEKLSSGLRINRAGDDAAGLAISETMRAQIRGLEQSQKNVQDGISFVQTMEGALNEVSAMLVRMKELNVQSANGTYSSDDTANITAELNALNSQITQITTTTNFNGKKLSDSIDIRTSDVASTVITIGSTTVSLGSTGESDVDAAIKSVTTSRGTLGALQNRLEYTSNNLGTTIENISASESRIRDTDMAKEMVELTKNNILLQASQAMLAQANQQPQGVLSLLR
ncbi:flagellin [Paenibacillus sp. MY03]|uniref:flagellin N-terminal helical domain-containing protein n=1 Tax=Paenibacillus sp. MY03 TaxID=302980 RepID=UPI000B3D22D9|nr:flagellin [Paenibacillus sp. MY03]OUS75146.1 flagellin [Paenibacillus sp. MY03]